MNEATYWRRRFLISYQEVKEIDLSQKVWDCFMGTPEGYFFGRTPEDILESMITHYKDEE